MTTWAHQSTDCAHQNLNSLAAKIGLEGWRRFARIYDGAGQARLHGNFIVLLNPERKPLKELSSYIIQWEERVRVYEQRSKEPLGGRVKASVLCRMTGGHKPPTEHLDLNSGRLRSYAQIREEITAYLEGRADSAAAQLRQGPAPMDVGAVGQGGKGFSSSWQAPPRGGGKGTGPLDGCFL